MAERDQSHVVAVLQSLKFNSTLIFSDIDECASDPCQNNATCVDLINEFRCDCVPGFNETLCDNSKTNYFITFS